MEALAVEFNRSSRENLLENLHDSEQTVDELQEQLDDLKEESGKKLADNTENWKLR